MSCISLLQIFEFVLVFRAPYHFEVGCTLFFPLLPTYNHVVQAVAGRLWMSAYSYRGKGYLA